MDINDQIAKHKGLIYKQLTAFNLLQDQDAESFAYEALHRAITTFNSDTGAAFSTYAVCCINNELRKHLRTLNRKRQFELVSYDAPLLADDSSCLADILEHPESVEQTLLSEEACAHIVDAFKAEYKLLVPKHRRVIRMFYGYEGRMTQKEIATSVGFTQATVSKIVSAFRHRVKVRMEEQE